MLTSLSLFLEVPPPDCGVDVKLDFLLRVPSQLECRSSPKQGFDCNAGGPPRLDRFCEDGHETPDNAGLAIKDSPQDCEDTLEMELVLGLALMGIRFVVIEDRR